MDTEALFPGERISHVAYIRTSDRSTYRRCRRKFGWSYLHRGNRTRKEARDPLWIGTGFHFAMEDFHGFKRYPDAASAFRAYALACKATPRYPLPPNWEELTDFTVGMLEYYEQWLQTRDALTTLVIDGQPQVEVRFEIPLDLDSEWLLARGFDRAIYTGTIDRVVVDEFGRIWLVDYKTAKIIQTGHLETDGQISAYCWAASKLYNLPIAGFIYQQHRKIVPHPPVFLKSAKMFSVAKNQSTTHTLYRTALVNLYGSVQDAPDVNVQFLNLLTAEETDRADKIIRRDYVERNLHQIEAEDQKIQMEAYEMLNPDLQIYPNPTRDCSWDCDFKGACLNMDDGSDWEYELISSTVDREEEDLSWRSHLILPSSMRSGREPTPAEEGVFQISQLYQPHRASRRPWRR